MYLNLLCGLLIFMCTSIGSILVSYIPINKKYFNICLSFSGGIMLSSFIFSLLLPSLEFNFIKVIIGIILGLIIILSLDKLVSDNNKSNNMLFAAMTIHNIPEGMLVGISTIMYFNNTISLSNLLFLVLGIGLQNIPEGASVTLNFRYLGYSKIKSIILGILSGIVEPIGCILIFIFYKYLESTLVYFLSSSASIMLYVIVTELLPQKNDNKGILSFYIGFIFMLCLDFFA